MSAVQLQSLVEGVLHQVEIHPLNGEALWGQNFEDERYALTGHL